MGGAVHPLSGEMIAGGEVFTFQILPNNLGVVYLADMLEDEVEELFLVSIFGGASTRLNPILVAGGSVMPTFSPTADSQRLVYAAAQDSAEVIELYLTQEGYGVYLPGVARP